MYAIRSYYGLIWFMLMLVPLIALQRVLHREIQAALYIASGGNAQLTMAIFSFLFFPGVVLHEFSHFIFAKVLFVRTRNFSIIPKMMPEGYLRMGYVEVAETDIVKNYHGKLPMAVGTGASRRSAEVQLRNNFV